MCLDAAVMGTCPTFINQSWKKKKKKGKRVQGGEEEEEGREGMPSEQEREGEREF